jgi:integrase
MIGDVPRPLPPHLTRETTRHGRAVWYVRMGHGKRRRIRADYGSAEFWQEYRDALDGKPTRSLKGPATGTLAWLIARYVESAEWKAKGAASRRKIHGVMRAVEKAAGHEPAKSIDRRSILAGRDRRRDNPGAANNFLAAMRVLFVWAADREYVLTDPTTGIKFLPPERDTGFHAWTEEELARFEVRWPVGTRERLAFDLLLYTGLRRGDVVKLGRQHVRRDEFTIATEKTGRVVTAPILPVLARTITKSSTGDLTFLVTERGLGFTKGAFGNWFRAACRAAGVPGVAHGLRKAGARRAAEAGASEAQLNALFGWAPGSKESSTYTRTADAARLARTAPRSPAPMTPVRERARKRK